MSENLFAAIRAGLPAPDKVFIETSGGAVFTYGDVLRLSARQAHALRAAGVRPGDRVAAQVEKSPQALVFYLACVRAGAVYLPLNTGYTDGEIAFFAADAEPALMLVDPARRADLARACPGVRLETMDAAGEGSLAGAAAGMAGDFPDETDGNDLAAVLYTSGTTGRPKGAMMSHANLLSNARVLTRLWRFTADDMLLHALPIYHTHGLFVATNIMLLAGGSMLFLPKFDAGEVMRLLPRTTAMMGVPTFYTRLLAEPAFGRAQTAHMRLFISGSAPLLAATHAEFAARTGHAILERYGMTETGMITSNPCDGARIAGTVGPAIPGTEVRIADPDSGRVLGPGETGVIEVRGPNVFSGYWRRPEQTAAEFRPDGFFVTGDIGTTDANGYVRIVGRARDLIISGGLNVYPKEVEEVIDALPGVAESAVIGVPHADLGEAVVAVVARGDGAATDEAAIRAATAGRLAGFKRPKRVFLVEALPRNAMGKVQKNVLRERYADTFAG